MQASPEEIRLLAQVGFLGATRGDVIAAQMIFSAIALERPGALVVFVGPAMAHLHGGQPAEAVACLERAEALVAEEDRPQLQAFLGLAYRASGQAARSVEALRKAGDVPLAQALLADAPANALHPA